MELKILKKDTLLLNDLSEQMEKRKKDILPVQQKVFDFSNKFSKFNKEVSHTLLEELSSLSIPRVDETHFIQIINLAPKSEPELKSIFSGSKTTVSAESIKKILEILKKYEK